MNTAFDPLSKEDKKKFPVKEGQGKEGSIRAEDENSDPKNYPELSTEDKQHKNQDEFDNKEKDIKNKPV